MFLWRVAVTGNVQVRPENRLNMAVCPLELGFRGNRAHAAARQCSQQRTDLVQHCGIRQEAQWMGVESYAAPAAGLMGAAAGRRRRQQRRRRRRLCEAARRRSPAAVPNPHCRTTCKLWGCCRPLRGLQRTGRHRTVHDRCRQELLGSVFNLQVCFLRFMTEMPCLDAARNTGIKAAQQGAAEH